jgi:hypothetical protein
VAGLLALTLGGSVLGFALAARSDGAAVSLAVPAVLPGKLTGRAPWPRNAADLLARLDTLHLPGLNSEGTALHIHAHLDVFVNGRHITVPAGIGIDPQGRFISPLHTHDRSGVIHVESPTVRSFTLGEFFGVWGVCFGQRCIGGYPAGHGKQLRVYVDGRRVRFDPSRLLLSPHEEIVVAFGRPRQLPRRVPAQYAFPAGE